MTDQQHPLLPLVRRLGAHSALSPFDIQAILALPFTLARRRVHSYMVRTGDEVSSLFVLVAGFAARHRTTGDGFRQIVSISIPGDPLNFDQMFLPTADDDLQVIKGVGSTDRAEIAVIRRADVHAMLERQSSAARAFVTAMLVDTAAFREWVLNVGQRDAAKRVAHLLCELALRMEAQGLASTGALVPLNQIHIGEATGLSAVHVNRTIKALEKDGSIVRRGQSIEIPDWRELCARADFDPHYLFLRDSLMEATECTGNETRSSSSRFDRH